LSNRSNRRLLAVLVSVLSVLLFSSAALAAGRVEWKTKNFKERSDKAWMLELAIYLPRAPDVAYVPMKFEFELVTYFERSLVDGHDGPVDTKTPMNGRQPLIESVDVGFMDAGTSKIEKRTRFSFKVKRDLGYEAGEYKVTIRDTRNGQTVGAPTTITFDGQNEVIDRRSIVFQGEGKKKKPEKKDEAKSEGDGEKKDDAKSDDSSGDGEKSDEGSSSDEASSGDEGSDNSGGDDPPPVEEKRGCGCRVPGTPSTGDGAAALLGLALLGTFVSRRRRAA
jgi:MYXO-CTERM domain-containing protein